MELNIKDIKKTDVITNIVIKEPVMNYYTINCKVNNKNCSIVYDRYTKKQGLYAGISKHFEQLDIEEFLNKYDKNNNAVLPIQHNYNWYADY